MFQYTLIGLGGQDGSPDTGRIPQIFVKFLELAQAGAAACLGSCCRQTGYLLSLQQIMLSIAK